MSWMVLAALTVAMAEVPPLADAERVEVGARFDEDADVAWVVEVDAPLREAPGGAVVRRLGVGARLEVLEEADGQARVRARGGEGWLDLRFVSSVRPMLAMLRGMAARSAGEERLRWASRAASIGTGWDTRVLIGALREMGAHDEAAAHEEGLGLPAHVWLAPTTRAPDLRVEYAVSGEAPLPWMARPQTGAGAWAEPAWEREVALTPADLAIYDIELGERWWVLPESGAAVPATVTAAVAVIANECGGSWAVEVKLSAELPDGARAVAFARGEPPASWRQAVPTPTGREDVEAAMRAAASAAGLEAAELSLAGAGERWWGRAASVVEVTGDGLARVRTLDLAHDADGLRIVGEGELHTWDGWERPWAARDVDGDGALETVWDSCGNVLQDGTGRYVAATEGRCCGC